MIWRTCLIAARFLSASLPVLALSCGAGSLRRPVTDPGGQDDGGTDAGPSDAITDPIDNQPGDKNAGESPTPQKKPVSDGVPDEIDAGALMADAGTENTPADVDAGFDAGSDGPDFDSFPDVSYLLTVSYTDERGTSGYHLKNTQPWKDLTWCRTPGFPAGVFRFAYGFRQITGEGPPEFELAEVPENNLLAHVASCAGETPLKIALTLEGAEDPATLADPVKRLLAQPLCLGLAATAEGLVFYWGSACDDSLTVDEAQLRPLLPGEDE